MLLALLALIYNELNNKYHWNKEELYIPIFALMDYVLIIIVGLILYTWYEILPALKGVYYATSYIRRI